MTGIMTFNVNGLGGAVNKKRRKLMNYLHNTELSIIALQETHSSSETEKFWKAEWGGPIFFSHGTSAARGVALMLNKRMNAKILNVTKDLNGRYLIVSMEINHNQYSFIVLYAPNEDNVDFFKDIFTVVSEEAFDLKIIMGDFNTVLDLDKDLIGGKGHSNPKTRAFLNEYCTENDLIDIWRLLHPCNFQSTFARKRPHPLRERIDYILISTALQQNVKQTEIITTIFSDHSPV